ncbi:3-methylcrotonyl-CoA carboxylase alpha subunit [Maritalea mobilis]|uniref:3-methylcrotonyl-CoA carboxylase alpha subunit n=1 Tax=Maritalea mobilis TaxID=483324 RepID=A0A4R6VHD1_9HYPH|nr:acetyl/propionyl/methylcrotonyl-CoA carboxylase subunit alpha [Maritalea mobilis]TDQ61993.1 3-methylcrotonyl-CoA carboxylase alpha subunit [Maritalea mobilis]
MFKKILIANRGEIACRVMRTAQQMGIQCVAIYSDADANAQHVQMADEAYHIGPSPVAESYLKANKIIEIVKRTGAEAVHPGYGFLSENPDFVEALEANNIRFIGPSADAIRKMGLKDAAKALMEEAGVPVVPGYHGDNQDADFLAAEAEKIGYPVLVKARAGGGGKGMRRVDDPKEFKSALEGAMREGQSSFGDPRVLIEKYITTPRHIEIQVFGDDHGNAVHLFERDCSLQRRHQKVIEEAPAPGMIGEMRNAMGEAAVKAAKAINYSGAGTVEFIVDAANGLNPNGFYFMEMNTRLQVEHPVTELITGQDLVAWQLRVASGEKLPMTQDDLSIDGWAFEARLYAEDVPKGFLPATGTLQHLALDDQTARIDSGVATGDEISPFYDPMIAKITVHANDRAEALQKLNKALGNSQIVGLVTNKDFLKALTEHKDFARGKVDTGLIDRDLNALIEPVKLPADTIAAAFIVASNLAQQPTTDIWQSLPAYRAWPGESLPLHLHHADREIIGRIQLLEGAYEVAFDDQTVEVKSAKLNGDKLVLNFGDHQQKMRANQAHNQLTLFADGQSHQFDIVEVELAEEATSGDNVISPMPGAIVDLKAKPGQAVKKGEKLITIEAMKMEHALAAPRDGVVAEVLVNMGDQVQDGAMLITLEPEDG